MSKVRLQVIVINVIVGLMILGCTIVSVTIGANNVNNIITFTSICEYSSKVSQYSDTISLEDATKGLDDYSKNIVEAYYAGDDAYKMVMTKDLKKEVSSLEICLLVPFLLVGILWLVNLKVVSSLTGKMV